MQENKNKPGFVEDNSKQDVPLFLQDNPTHGFNKPSDINSLGSKYRQDASSIKTMSN